MSEKIKARRNPWPIAIIAYFAVFITCMTGWIVFAVRNDLDLVRKDYYDEEIRFQKQIDKVKLTAAVANEVAIEYEPAQRAIRVRLPEGHHNPTGEIHLYRPSDAKLDQRVRLEVGAGGSQTINAAGLKPGYWKLLVSWKAEDQEFYHEKPVVIE